MPRYIQSIDQRVPTIFSSGKFFQKSESPIKKGDHIYTWKHCESFPQSQPETTYLYLFLEKDQKLSDFSRDPERMMQYENCLRSHMKACHVANVCLESNRLTEVVPLKVLKNLLSFRESAMKQVVRTVEKPSNYDILSKAHIVATSVSNRTLNTINGPEKIYYDIKGSATGRFTTTRKSYPILNLNKDKRHNLIPQNDLFLELDLNAAEMRTLMALSGHTQPQIDVHVWNLENSPEQTTRAKMKEKFFAWLYNPNAQNDFFEKVYKKDIYKKFYTAGKIETPFGRSIEVEERKALNYLLQSTTSDIVVESAYKILNFLKKEDSRSFLAFTMHDSIVLDFKKEDAHLVPSIKNIFEGNMFGDFLANVSIGKNFGNMEKIKV